MRARCVPDLGVSSGAAALVVAVLGAAAITVAPLTPWPLGVAVCGAAAVV